MSADVLHFPVERTKRARVDEAWRVYEDALRAWHAAQGTPLPPRDKETPCDSVSS